MPNVVQETLDYIYKLKTDDEEFLRYLYKNQNFSNDYIVLYALCKQNIKFIQREYYRQRKKSKISN